MSKYSRTRKAICRISHLSYWIVNRSLFRQMKPRTWKDTYRRYKKGMIKCYGCNYHNLKKYQDVIDDYNISIWNLPGISSF